MEPVFRSFPDPNTISFKGQAPDYPIPGVDNLPNAPIFIGERYKVIGDGYKNYSHSVLYY